MQPDVITCRRCSRTLTLPVVQVAEVPAREHTDDEQSRFAPTMPAGSWVVDPRSRMQTADGEPADTPGCLVINPADALQLEPHPDPRRNCGCCGHDGLDGPNLRCPECHAEVATVSDDCWTVVELRFEPTAVLAVAAG